VHEEGIRTRYDVSTAPPSFNYFGLFVQQRVSLEKKDAAIVDNQTGFSWSAMAVGCSHCLVAVPGTTRAEKKLREENSRTLGNH